MEDSYDHYWFIFNDAATSPQPFLSESNFAAASLPSPGVRINAREAVFFIEDYQRVGIEPFYSPDMRAGGLVRLSFPCLTRVDTTAVHAYV
jgi:hypothetical protein